MHAAMVYPQAGVPGARGADSESVEGLFGPRDLRAADARRLEQHVFERPTGIAASREQKHAFVGWSGGNEEQNDASRVFGVLGIAFPHSVVHVIALQRRGSGRRAAQTLHSGAFKVERGEILAAAGDDQQALQAGEQGNSSR